MEIFKIETKMTYWGDEYRFCSLYNGTRGPWCYSQEVAIEQGKEHQEIILALHGKEALTGEVADETR